MHISRMQVILHCLFCVHRRWKLTWFTANCVSEQSCGFPVSDNCVWSTDALVTLQYTFQKLCFFSLWFSKGTCAFNLNRTVNAKSRGVKSTGLIYLNAITKFTSRGLLYATIATMQRLVAVNAIMIRACTTNTQSLMAEEIRETIPGGNQEKG